MRFQRVTVTAGGCIGRQHHGCCVFQQRWQGGTATATLAAALLLTDRADRQPGQHSDGSTTTLTFLLTNPNGVTLTDWALQRRLAFVGLRRFPAILALKTLWRHFDRQ